MDKYMIFRMMIFEIQGMDTFRIPEDIIIFFNALSLSPSASAAGIKSDGNISRSQYNGFLRDFNIFFYSNFYSTCISSMVLSIVLGACLGVLRAELPPKFCA